ncbi:hypothetical protein RI367_000577 [Sorochytrium milnesiophthora]
MALVLLIHEVDAKKKAVAFYYNWYKEQYVLLNPACKVLQARHDHSHLGSMIKAEDADLSLQVAGQASLDVGDPHRDPSVLGLERKLAGDMEQQLQDLQQQFSETNQKAQVYEDMVASKVVEDQERTLARLKKDMSKLDLVQNKKLEDLYQRHEELLHMSEAMAAGKLSDLGENATQSELKKLSAKHLAIVKDNRRLHRELYTIRAELHSLSTNINMLERHNISLMEHNNLEIDWNMHYGDADDQQQQQVDNLVLPSLPAPVPLKIEPVGDKPSPRKRPGSLTPLVLPSPSPPASASLTSGGRLRHDLPHMTANDIYDEELHRVRSSMDRDDSLAVLGTRKTMARSGKEGGTRFYF